MPTISLKIAQCLVVSRIDMCPQTRPTEHQVTLIDIQDEVPLAGQDVLALTNGGVLIKLVWQQNCISYVDAWCRYPKAPESVKRRISQRYQKPQ